MNAKRKKTSGRMSDSQDNRRRAQLLKELSAERRAIFERIQDLRARIGKVDFDIVGELRRLRGGGSS